MGNHEYAHRDRSVAIVWTGIFALVSLLIYIAFQAFSTSTGAPVAKADRGIEADQQSLQDPPRVSGGPHPKKPLPVPTVTLQGYQKTIPGPKTTVTKTVPTPVPGPTIRVTQSPTIITKILPGPTPKPAPTVTKTVTAPAVAPEPTATVTVTETVTAKPKHPRPTVTVTIYVPRLIASPDPSPSGAG